MSDEQRNTKPVDDNYQADLDDVGFWLRVALLQPPQMSYGGVSVKTIPTEQIKAMLRTLDQQATFEAERDAARAEVERLRAACEPIASSLEANLGYATGKPYFWDGPEGREIVQHTLRNAANNLRAALESEVDHD